MMSIQSQPAKERLVETAAHLFEMQGYYATGLNQILKESGSPKGSLYYYFPEGKEELACEAVNRTARDVEERIRDGLAKHDDPVLAIQSFVREMAMYFEASACTGGVPVAAVVLETASVSDPIREACASAYKAWIGVFTEKLRANGYEPSAAERLATVINSMIEGAVIVSRTRKSSSPLEAVAEVIPLLLRSP